MTHICPNVKWTNTVWASERCANHMQSAPVHNYRECWSAVVECVDLNVGWILIFLEIYNLSVSLSLSFLFNSSRGHFCWNTTIFVFFLPLRSLRLSWRALRPWGCSATRSVTTRPSRTKRMERAQTASWGRDRSRYDMTSPPLSADPSWLIVNDGQLCHHRCHKPWNPYYCSMNDLNWAWCKNRLIRLITSLCNGWVGVG